jgi:hypothetical protein
MIGKYVIVRTYSAGVLCGVLKEIYGRVVVLTDASRIWRWQGANTLNEIALRGCAENSRISEPVPEIMLTEAVEVIPCLPESEANLRRPRWSD